MGATKGWKNDDSLLRAISSSTPYTTGGLGAKPWPKRISKSMSPCLHHKADFSLMRFLIKRLVLFYIVPAGRT